MKRSERGNLKKHGIDFVDVEKIFRGVTLTAEDTREAYGDIRIISIRKATRHEARYYFSQIFD
jgi:uncharacterized protein